MLPAMVKATLIPRDAPDHYATAVDKKSFNNAYTPDSVIVTLSIALAYYNILELILLMSSTFKKCKGLYFWSLAMCNFGVFLYTLGINLSYFELCVQWLWKTILDIGWVAMLTCQSLVLYSRLGLILSSSNILAAVKWMIIFDSIVLCTLVIVLDFGNTYAGMDSFSKGYYYIEQIQLIWFTVQELIISGLYVWKTLAWLKIALKENTRTVIWQLFAINVIIIAMDIALVTLQYLHYQLYQEAIKAFVYSVKLKLELNILSRLVDLVEGGASRRSMTLDAIDVASMPGQGDIHRKSSAQPPSGNDFRYATNDMLKQPDDTDELGLSTSGSSISAGKNDDGINRVTSTHSRATARTSGRETDMMYADMLRSIK